MKHTYLGRYKTFYTCITGCFIHLLVYKIKDTRWHLLFLEQMTIESSSPRNYERYKPRLGDAWMLLRYRLIPNIRKLRRISVWISIQIIIFQKCAVMRVCWKSQYECTEYIPKSDNTSPSLCVSNHLVRLHRITWYLLTMENS